MRTRIIIADDNEHYRTALALILEAANMEVVEEVSTGREAVDATSKNDPDVLLLDIDMPEMDGLASLATIKYLCPKTKIIVITSSTNPILTSRVEDLGADAFIDKATDTPILINTVRTIASEVVQTENPTGTVKCNGMGQLKDHSRAPNFTQQECRILSCLSQGQDNDTISTRLTISANTLKTHMRNIFKKLECTNRTQVALWAIRNGFDE